MAEGSGFRVQGLGFRGGIKGLGLRAEASGDRIKG